MQNRWNEAEAAGMDELDQLVYQSRLLGADTSLVLWGGGNTSIKTAEIDFRGAETYVLRVKGSGSDMKSITRQGFAGVRMVDILPLEEREDMTDEAMVEYLSHTLMDPAAPRPSIETLLHGFLPYKSVAHSHADAIVALTDNVNGAEAVRDCYGGEMLTVDYIRPGFLLSKQVAAAAKAQPSARALILMNHGLITWGDTAKEAYDLHIEAVTKAEEYLADKRKDKLTPETIKVHALSEEDRKRIAAKLGPVLRGAMIQAQREVAPNNPLRRLVMRFDDSESVLEFAGSEAAATVSQIGTATPDHLLHTKRVPLFLKIDDPTDIETATIAIREQAVFWAREYAAYFRRNSELGETMLDASPRVVLLPGIGMWTVGKDAKTALVPSDIYHHTISVIGMASGVGDYNSITENEAFHVEYWPLELYKLTLAPPEKDLARRVALITGACGAIGKAIAEQFGKEGCHLVVTDLDQAACDELATALCKKNGAGTAVGVAMNVSDEESVKNAFRQTAIAFGGVDIVVSNAGIAHSARIDVLELKDWERSLAVNATGHFLVAKEAVKLFREQGIGGNIVFNVTKNAFAAGAEFGAYSASKAAELQLARVIAIENGGEGIRVNMLNPDAIFSAGLWSTEIKEQRAQAQGIDVADIEEFYRKRNLLKVKITAEDVAEAALWLASDKSAKTTGAVIPVDGGIREAFPR
jgi:rhamnulose-1-phosphate aldolase/alcohol dehydrogenase